MVYRRKNNYEIKKSIIGNGSDYYIYPMKALDYVAGYLIGFILFLIAFQIFF